MEDVAIPGRL